MNEHTLQKDLLKLLRERLPKYWLILKHADSVNSGYPDMSVSGLKRSTWWELKHATPLVKGTGLQQVRMCQMEVASYARYIVYRKVNGVYTTDIVLPSSIRMGNYIAPEASIPGIDHEFVLQFIRDVHEAL